MPELEAMRQRLASAGIDLVGLNVDTEPGAPVAAFAGERVRYPVVRLEPSAMGRLYSTDEVVVPLSLLVDADGRLAELVPGWSDATRRRLEQLPESGLTSDIVREGLETDKPDSPFDPRARRAPWLPRRPKRAIRPNRRRGAPGGLRRLATQGAVPSCTCSPLLEPGSSRWYFNRYLLRDVLVEDPMALSLTEDVKTVSELKQSLRSVFEQIHQTGRPVVVTVNGKPDVVLMDAAQFERKLRALNLAALLARGEDDIRRGRTRPARSLLRELKREAKVPR